MKEKPLWRGAAGGGQQPALNFKFKNSILGKLSLSFVSIITAALILVGMVTYIYTEREVRNQFVSSARQVLGQNQNYVDFIVNTVENYGVQLLGDNDLKGKLTSSYSNEFVKYTIQEEIIKKLNGMLISNSAVKSIYIINPDGISAGAPQMILENVEMDNISISPYYKKAVELGGKGFWMTAHDDEFTYGKNVKCISYVRQMKDMNTQKSTGVLKINISPEVFQKALAGTAIGIDGYMYIIDGDGNIISHPDSSLLGTSINDREYIKNILSSENKSSDFDYYDSEKGTGIFGVYTVSEKTGWTYIAVVPSGELTAPAARIRNIIILISLLCLLITMVAAMLISLSIVRPLREVSAAMDRVEKGDLSAEVGYKSKDELGKLSSNFNSMVLNLKKIIKAVKDAVDDTEGASCLIGSSSQQLAASTSEVARVIEEIASGAGNQAQQASKGVEIADGFGRNVESVVAYSGEVYRASMDAMGNTDRGMKSVTALKDRSNDSVGIITKVSDSISELSQNAKEIQDILESITKISQQTNLLSLNAAIEAARAGEAGRGFAVVAAEVRKLAVESKAAADNINIIIKKVNARTADSVNTARSMVSLLKEEVNYINDTLDVFSSIKGSIDIVGDKLGKLNQNLGSIGRGKDEILRAIEEISAISQETAASTEEVSASAEEQAASVQEMNSMATGLSSLSEKLKALTDKFAI